MITELDVLNRITGSLETQLTKLNGNATSRYRVLLWLSSWIADQLDEGAEAEEKISS